MADAAGFNRDLHVFADSIDVSLETVVRKIALRTFNSIVLKTPVDTGRARASWVIGINRALDSPAVPAGLTAGEAAGRAARQLTTLGQLKPYDTVFISNNLPYIETLEDGNSKQAPAGMVAVTLAEVERDLDKLTNDF